MNLLKVKGVFFGTIFLFVLTACQLYLGNSTMAIENSESVKQIAVPLGRFSISPPESMKFVAGNFVLHYTEVKEIQWQQLENHEQERERIWKKILSDISASSKPDGVKDNIIDLEEWSDFTTWHRSVTYYSNPYIATAIGKKLFADYGAAGVIFTIEGAKDKKDLIEEIFKTVVKSYALSPLENLLVNNVAGPKFGTPQGIITLNRRGREKVYARFEGHPLKLKLEIDMKVVEKVEKTNIIERLSAALLTNFAPGVSIDKIRTGQRTVAGLKGDEVIMRGKEGDKVELSFAWRFNGEKNSATAPKFTIEMESKDGQLDEKLAVWDAILDSIQVIPQ